MPKKNFLKWDPNRIKGEGNLGARASLISQIFRLNIPYPITPIAKVDDFPLLFNPSQSDLNIPYPINVLLFAPYFLSLFAWFAVLSFHAEFKT